VRHPAPLALNVLGGLPGPGQLLCTQEPPPSCHRNLHMLTSRPLLSASFPPTQPCRALEVWGGMRRQGVAPNTVTYNTLVSACAKAGLYARAQVRLRPVEAGWMRD